MATKGELFKAVRLIKEHCIEHDACVRDGHKCPLWIWCFKNSKKIPSQWPDLEEGGGEDG